MTTKPVKIFHNPQKVPASMIPPGWQLRLVTDAGSVANTPCRIWISRARGFSADSTYRGVDKRCTYIVPLPHSPDDDEPETKPLDPKGEAGAKKPQLQLIPPVLGVETAKALVDGAGKYGAWNWRLTNVEMMTYLGAMKRHIDALIDGEDVDPKSGAHHLGHVAAGCGIVLDARKHGTLVDNRPPFPNIKSDNK